MIVATQTCQIIFPLALRGSLPERVRFATFTVSYHHAVKVALFSSKVATATRSCQSAAAYRNVRAGVLQAGVLPTQANADRGLDRTQVMSTIKPGRSAPEIAGRRLSLWLIVCVSITTQGHVTSNEQRREKAQKAGGDRGTGIFMIS